MLGIELDVGELVAGLDQCFQHRPMRRRREGFCHRVAIDHEDAHTADLVSDLSGTAASAQT